ncbi:MAG TPA: hypothetical protein VJ577_07120 [Burkholderiaceae bacterium]|nr:hypothetical protein [Burkholderiaceae bacterium]
MEPSARLKTLAASKMGAMKEKLAGRAEQTVVEVTLRGKAQPDATWKR